MRPTLAAEQVQGSLSQYLSTTYALADEGTRRALEDFLTDPEEGIFRGPYLRIRTPFQVAGEGWQRYLGWWPRDFLPYAHQARAWERLSTLHGVAEPTLVTTGTGSGKTESFLVPVLDHCRRARVAGQEGVKALLLYPMNALATDQAHRLSELLEQDPRLKDVTAGLYVGDTPSAEVRQAAPKVMMRREEIRRARPDILITNYKMLDLLVQRPEDQRLWRDCPLAYVVLDEFHTYDGAQGTDVAMLLRRLGAVTGLARPGRPLGGACPVATSATLGEGGTDGDAGPMTSVAEQIFGIPFPAAAVVGENRQSAGDVTGDPDFSLPFPNPQEVNACGDPLRDPGAVDRLAAAFTGESGLLAEQLGDRLRQHRMTGAVLEILGGRPRTMAEILSVLPRYAYHWGAALQQRPREAAQALARYVALLSTARDPEHPGRPLLSIEVHHWVRPVAQLLRGVALSRAEFRWDDERMGEDGQLARDGVATAPVAGPGPDEAPAPGEDSAPPPAQVYLPAVYCRECGRSGWAALATDTDAVMLELKPKKTRRASVSADKRRVRNMIAATPAEARRAAQGGDIPRGGAAVLVLDAAAGRIRPLDPARDLDGEGNPAPRLRDVAFVLAEAAADKAAEAAAQRDECPACGTSGAIFYLGTGIAALAAASVTQLFTGGELNKSLKENKTLLFNDSVQDAAHRAGYVANRSYTFSFRSLLARGMDEEEPIALNDLAADIMGDVADSQEVRAAVIPPDLHTVPGVDTLLSGRSKGSRRTWELIAERLAFSAVMEFGLSSRLGRTLELTRTAAAEVLLADPDGVSGIVEELLRTTPGEIALPGGSVPDAERYVAYVRGVLERLRLRGAIRHRWLDPWLREGGTSRFGIWGGRPTGMPAFPPGRAAPSFLLSGAKQRSEFDSVTGRGGWYQDWTVRCLGLQPQTTGLFLPRLLRALADARVLSVRSARDGSGLYGLQPGHIQVRKLSDDVVSEAVARCASCGWQQTVHPDSADHWHGQPCLRYRCGGELRTGHVVDPADPSSLRERDYTQDYYRRMYREAGAYTINTAEHTGTLTRGQREAVEQAFRAGTDAHYANPQILSCTPTLELGIDIGDLSAVVLASLPTGPANYVQRTGRAGRRTGNAYLLTLVGNRPRDRYYLEEPRQMIAGDIRPPGCFLSAVEILRRQYTAHLLDLAGAGRLRAPGSRDTEAPLPPLPHRASALFGASGWLQEFAEAALADGQARVSKFLALFPAYDEDREQGVSPRAAEELHAYAIGGLRGALHEAQAFWERRKRELQQRLAAIDTAARALDEGGPEAQQQARELRAERRSVTSLQRAHGSATAQQALVDLGLLPNYGLMESRTELEALLTWREEGTAGKDSKPEYRTKTLVYERSARLALTDFAPGNTFYVQGYKHRVTGVDIGSVKRPAWLWWRVCPSCGYVRTHRAEHDPSPCPRCHSAAIADNGCLHRVISPRRVQSRDKRDDARVRDDRDEREQRHYTVVTAVDIPPEAIDQAWRHKSATFGWEFTRSAAIRRINVGTARADGSGDAFAGQQVRLNPFWICATCGHADPDGGPDDPAKRAAHHRPWCPRLREEPPHTGPRADGVDILLAQELRTEALRILIPAVTAHTEERRVSLKAALLAGVSRSYGGDPDHLAVTPDSMPEPGSGDSDLRRHYLTLYDTLPGGTGYLHRMAGRDGLLQVLSAAREVIEGCVCRQEGRQACHRCLLRHIDDNEYAYASRDQALDILSELLGPDGSGWNTEPVASAADITLVRQLESELEQRFFNGLLTWAARADVEASARSERTADGRRSSELRLTAPDGAVTRWQVDTQQDLGWTRPDVVFHRLDAEPLRVAVYLDGYRYHASPECNRVADDAAKRTRLRAEGWHVFQLTWDDVESWTGHAGHAGNTAAEADPVWKPYGGNAQREACDWYRKGGADPREMQRYIWANPVETLLGYLAQPDAERWLLRVQSALAGTVRAPGASATLGDGEAVAERIADALAGKPFPGGKGKVRIARIQDNSGCSLVFAIDLRQGPEAASWTALTVLDDAEETIEADQKAHRRRWRAWLYWTNLLQFLNEGEGDGVQLTASLLPGFDLSQLAVTGGGGWLASQRSQPAVTADRQEQPGQHMPGTAGSDPGWDEVLEYLEDDPGLHELAHALADRGVPAPEQGYELGGEGWLAELAWPAQRVAVVLSHRPGADGSPDTDAEDRDRAYAKAGWQARTAAGWDVDVLAVLLDTGTQRGTPQQKNEE
ncbi:DEAD/DEAH box helicase [Streptomyces gobiensis]|uniref:DEAD/DEAH box helicase n=1 Tax=Streptomyces gobiensis TaxID=2875706 RepID=UPI001E4576E2|nr:DEAD/DEAH box helicase [Streptomyces gobiensis]UGY90764.1 DEAD/DEAH box helicase [Streptomyces gobiensis]